jgi:quercetin 2,3-dioxygenase
VGALWVWTDDEIAPKSNPRYTRMLTQKSSPMCARVRSRTGTALAIRTARRPATFKIMSDARIRHAEYNLEPRTTKIFQIWIEPSAWRQEPG